MHGVFLFVMLAANSSAAGIQATPQAQTPQQKKKEARRDLKEGNAALQAGNIELALKDFSRAYELSHLGKLLFDIARCERLLENWAEARDYYERYLNEVPEGRSRELAIQQLAEVKQKLAETEAARPPPPPDLHPTSDLHPASNLPAPRLLARMSLLYDPEIPLTSGSLNLGDVMHGIGLEVSGPVGPALRYHFEAAYVTLSGVSGLRVDALTFGWTIPLLVQRDLRLEIEPMIPFLDGVVLFAKNGSSDLALLLSSGIGCQINLAYGVFYAFVSPFGLEFRYFAVLPQENGSENAVGGLDVSYRLKVGVGLQY